MMLPDHPYEPLPYDELVRHLAEDGSHAGKYKREVLDRLSATRLREIHRREHHT